MKPMKLTLTNLKNIRAPADLRKAIAASPRAQATWDDITPNARRDWIVWLITAKQSETRKRRIKKACSMLASGKRRVCCFGGIKWLMKTAQNELNLVVPHQ
jgi:uncharacterized protein YdeI (YjbR/CyaY-like superfamily)